jgi:hypothetical protein
MPASLRQRPENHKLDGDHEHIIECSQGKQENLLGWDDKESGNGITSRIASGITQNRPMRVT